MILNFDTYNEFMLCESVRIHGHLGTKTRKKFKELLRHNIVVFKFVKKDGTIRKAKGTLHPDLIGPVKGTGYTRPKSILIYWDLEKEAYRSFNNWQFIKVMSEEPLPDTIVKEKPKQEDEDSEEQPDDIDKDDKK